MMTRLDQFLTAWPVRLVRVGQFLLALGIFTWLSLTTQVASIQTPDTWLHFVGNLLLFLSARVAFLELKSPWFILLFVLVYGTSMEILQLLLTSRYFDPVDLAANWLGVLAGFCFSLLVSWLAKNYINAISD